MDTLLNSFGKEDVKGEDKIWWTKNKEIRC